jgi:hypothetical protein
MQARRALRRIRALRQSRVCSVLEKGAGLWSALFFVARSVPILLTKPATANVNRRVGFAAKMTMILGMPNPYSVSIHPHR